jgi:hypothetical protein
MMDYYADEFGYTEDEVVALMGAHTLGKNHLSRSGYSGVFVQGGNTVFDNHFYSDMVDSDVTWSNELVRFTSLYQWGGESSDGTDYGTRLNTDLELLYDVTLDADDNSATCTVDTCSTADTYATVSTYASVS